jgi:hypothetical protein
MMSNMTWRAHPNNLQRLVVVLVMANRLDASTCFARLSNQGAGADCPGSCAVGGASAAIFRSPFFCEGGRQLNPIFVFCPVSIVLPYSLKVFFSVLANISFCAFLALVEMAVCHVLMSVKLCQWLDGLALKTFL